jgi:hypothetical protein
MRTLLIFALLLLISQHSAQAQKAAEASERGKLLEVAAFAIGLEAEASHLTSNKNLCVALDTRLPMSEKDLISKLKRSGLVAHSSEWCNRGRGYRIEIHAPIDAWDMGKYEIQVEVGDMTIMPGEHFATKLKQGTYQVKFEEGAQPEFISYRKSCCPRSE